MDLHLLTRFSGDTLASSMEGVIVGNKEDSAAEKKVLTIERKDDSQGTEKMCE